MKNIREKRGVSAVVATVLLVLIAFMAVGIVIGVIIPMVREGLEKGKSCFELREYFKIVPSDYTCYNSTTTKLMVERGMEDFEVKGFAVSIMREGKSERYDIFDRANYSDVAVKGGNFGKELELPGPGEARTYIFKLGNGNKVEISVIKTDNTICEPESYNIPPCP